MVFMLLLLAVFLPQPLPQSTATLALHEASGMAQQRSAGEQTRDCSNAQPTWPSRWRTDPGPLARGGVRSHASPAPVAGGATMVSVIAQKCWQGWCGGNTDETFGMLEGKKHVSHVCQWTWQRCAPKHRPFVHNIVCSCVCVN